MIEFFTLFLVIMSISNIKRRYKIIGGIFISISLYLFLPIPDFIAAKIAWNGQYEHSVIGFTNTPSIQYQRYIILNKISSDEKLISLYLNHKNTAVKCYAFKALLHRNIDHINLLKQGIFDEREISIQFADLVWSNKIGDLLISEYKEQLNKNISVVIDSILLYSNTQLSYKNHILENKVIDKKHYAQVLKLVKNNSTPSALVALAKFQKFKDTIFINQVKHDTLNWNSYFQAISNFPLKNFENSLISIHDYYLTNPSQTIFSLYEAMVSIESTNIQNQLKKVLELEKIQIKDNKEKKRLCIILDSLKKEGYQLRKHTLENQGITLFDTTIKYEELVLDSSIISKISKYVPKKTIRQAEYISDLKTHLDSNINYFISMHKEALYEAIKLSNHDYYINLLPLIHLHQSTKMQIEDRIKQKKIDYDFLY